MKLRAFKRVSVSTLREGMRMFRPALSKQRLRITFAVFITIALSAVRVLQPWPLKVILDSVLTQGSRGLWSLSPRETVAAAAAATLLITAFHGILNLRFSKISARVAQDLTVGVRRQVFEHLHRLAVPFHSSQRTGELLYRLMGDVNIVRDTLFSSSLGAVGSVLTFVTMAVLMVVLDPLLAALAVLPLPFVGIFLRRSARKLKEATRKQRRKQGHIAARAAESLQQIHLVKAYAAEGREIKEFSRQSRAGEEAGVRAAGISGRMERTTNILTGFGLALVLLVGARRALAGAASVGDLIVILTYVRALYQPLGAMSGAGVRMGRASAAMDRILEVLHTPPEDRSSGRPAPVFAGEIEFVGVRFSYPGGVEALKGVSCQIPAGALALLTGPNGAGKSTAVALLLRLLEPDQGEILIDGEGIDSFRLDSYRRRFAFVPQPIQLFGATLRENILYGRPDASEEEMLRAARTALLDEVAARLPGGYDAMLGEGGGTLSGGEARRLMLARAALRDARILLLDEPLVGLDAEARDEVARATRQVAAGRTTIVITHDAVSEFGADTVLQLDAGHLATAPRAVEPPEETEALAAWWGQRDG